jgi:hypothetical protein
MQMAIRIKASEAFEDLFALELVGGKKIDGKYPKFKFENQTQRQEYDRIRKQLKEGEPGVRDQQAKPSPIKAGNPPIQYRGRVGLQRLE